MTRNIALTTAALLLSGASVAFAAGGQNGAAAEGTSPEAGAEETTPSVGGAAPASEHQTEALREEEQEFASLDENQDDKISYEEAQKSPTLSSYWKEHDLGEDKQMDHAEFAEFVSTKETGTDVYEGERKAADVPSSEHQEEVTREGPESGDSGSEPSR